MSDHAPHAGAETDSSVEQAALPAGASRQKYLAETRFWREEIDRYVAWFDGTYADFYGVLPPPREVRQKLLRRAALAAWCQADRCRYLAHLYLPEYAFRGCKVLEIGCGPLGLAQAFIDCELTGVDPLLGAYEAAGYPLDEHRIQYVEGRAEDLAALFQPATFDAVIAVNSIDHVDDFEAAIAAAAAVLKPDGRWRIECHYHAEEKTEPIVLDDARVTAAFAAAGRPDVLKVADVPFTHFYPPGYRPATDRLTVWGS